MDEISEFTKRVALQAGALIRSRWNNPRRIGFKLSAVDLVTDCDRAVEDYILSEISRTYPDHAIIAEETGGNGSSDREYCWLVDPLDGTTNWVHTLPHVSVSIAVARGAKVFAAAVYDPLRDEMFHAQRGHGAWRNGQRISPSQTATLEAALLATGFPYDCRERADFYLSFVGHFMKVSRGLRRFGSAALDLCYVASGRFDGFWEWNLRPWDTAAGSLVLEEAGGQITDFQGLPLPLTAGQTLASNGRIHGPMLEILGRRTSSGGDLPHASR